MGALLLRRLVVLTALVGAWAVGEDLIQPPSISSSGGTLSAEIRLQVATHTVPGFSITTRLFNGIVPGPTLRLQAGDLLAIDFFNDLPDQGRPYVHNSLSAPNESNLHFHGLHISGELPSDDTTHVVLPGGSYQYRTRLPDTHMPGTHWMHPHRHGSTALQAAGGAIAAVIVEDPPGTLPPQVEGAQEFILLVQPVRPTDIQNIASQAGDGIINLLQSPGNFVAVNGQVEPAIRVDPNEWIRLRMISAFYDVESVTYTISGCEMQLLAKDGIYIRDFPRSISAAPIPTGGRADIMVRCPAASTTYTISADGGTIATIETSANAPVGSTSLASWTPTYPPYLQDLRNTPASSGCSCLTRLGRSGGVNEVRFQYDTYIHTTYAGAVVERTIPGNRHPYHQHVYPFQLIDGFTQTAYNRYGDWHDTFASLSIRMRYRATEFEGKVMLHCHRLIHEDEGMMAAEWVRASADDTCSCGVFVNANQLPPATPPAPIAPPPSAPPVAGISPTPPPVAGIPPTPPPVAGTSPTPPPVAGTSPTPPPVAPPTMAPVPVPPPVMPTAIPPPPSGGGGSGGMGGGGMSGGGSGGNPQGSPVAPSPPPVLAPSPDPVSPPSSPPSTPTDTPPSSVRSMSTWLDQTLLLLVVGGVTFLLVVS